jgi:hypothetical protein
VSATLCHTAHPSSSDIITQLHVKQSLCAAHAHNAVDLLSDLLVLPTQKISRGQHCWMCGQFNDVDSMMCERADAHDSHSPPLTLLLCSALGAELLQKLYKHKLEALLKQQGTTLVRCSSCGQLYPVHSHSRLQCPTIAGACTAR